MKTIKIGVNDLLSILFRPKDLGMAFVPATRGQEGTVGHQLLTSQRPFNYKTEVPIDYCYNWNDYQLIVQGRIDGLLESETELMVEEIKTTYISIDDLTPERYPQHQAQLKLYLFFMASKYPNQPITGRLTYLNLDDLSEKTFPIEFDFDKTRRQFIVLAEKFLATHQDQELWRKIRNHSIANLPFPFTQPRPGQDELMDYVRQAIEQERDLFVEAATGIGKTIAVLYPSLKQLAISEQISQIFFLTAKTAGKEILQRTIATAKEEGLRLRTVFIEAKERVCLSPGSQCHPHYCPYALDYYPKAEQALPELLKAELITPELVMNSAKQGMLCPFELSLDLSLQADLIVGDYNYVFDPGVYLRRFFLHSGRKDFLFLVDEAHNLVFRGRDMYSATLYLHEIENFQHEMETLNPKIATHCKAVANYFQVWLHEMTAEKRPGIKLSHLPDLLEPSLEKLAAAIELLLRQRLPMDLRRRIQDFYFSLTSFIRISTLVNKDYAIYVKQEDERFFLRLFCLNPGPQIRKRIMQGRLAIFFSATLSPQKFFRDLLGGSPDALSIQLTSPFPQETRLYLQVPGIDTRFRNRVNTAPALIGCIKDFVAAHRGNYLIFFPSYTYLKAIWPQLKPELAGNASIYVQMPAMKDSQKQEFLKQISSLGSGRSNVGLAVLGGLFGEGIDLPGEKLVGALIIGPALPVVSDEQELIKQYFDEQNSEGFLYAYLIPGLIRVIQASGRVFRTPEDKGAVLFVDDRFLDERYQELLPPDWFMPGRSFSDPDYRKVLRQFWDE